MGSRFFWTFQSTFCCSFWCVSLGLKLELAVVPWHPWYTRAHDGVAGRHQWLEHTLKEYI